MMKDEKDSSFHFLQLIQSTMFYNNNRHKYNDRHHWRCSHETGLLSQGFLLSTYFCLP